MAEQCSKRMVVTIRRLMYISEQEVCQLRSYGEDWEVVAHAFNLSTWQGDLRVRGRLVYRISSRTARAKPRNFAWKKRKRKEKKEVIMWEGVVSL